MGRDVKQISVEISSDARRMISACRPTPPHPWLAFRVFSLDEMIIRFFVPAPPASLFSPWFVLRVLQILPLRPPSFTWITSDLSSNHPRPILCPDKHSPLSDRTSSHIPVWRAGRAESETPRIHHHEDFRAVQLTGYGNFPY